MRIGEILVAEGADRALIERALQEQAQSGERLGTLLAKHGIVDTDAVARALARQHGVPAARTKHFERVTGDIACLIPRRLAHKYRVVPIGVTAKGAQELVIAMRDPTDAEAIDEIGFITGARVRPAVAPESLIERYLEKLYPVQPAGAGAPRRPVGAPPSAPGAPSLDLTPPPVSPPPRPASAGDELELAVPVPSSRPATSPPAQMISPDPLPMAHTVGGGPSAASGFALLAVKVLAAIAGVAMGAWVVKTQACASGADSSEVDVGGQVYYVEHTRTEIELPPGWSYLPDEDISERTYGMTARGAQFYSGGTQDTPNQCLVVMSLDSNGKIPSRLGDQQFRQILGNISRASSQNTMGMSLSVGDCQVISAHTDQTGECRGKATYKGKTWDVDMYIWLQPGGWLLEAVFLTQQPLEQIQPMIDDILMSIRLRN